MLGFSVQVATLWRFLSDMEGSFQARTICNYSAALQWHLVYIRFLLHPDMTSENSEEQLIQKALQPSSNDEFQKMKKEMKEGMKKLRSLIGKTSDIAERQTKDRNGKEALSSIGRWVEVDWMTKLKQVVDEEG